MTTGGGMSEEQRLQQVKQLIQQKEYTKARQILRQMSPNPTAKKWLLKLDEIAPEIQSPSKTPFLKISSVLVVILLIGASFAIGRMTADSSDQSLEALAPALTQLVITPTCDPYCQEQTQQYADFYTAATGWAVDDATAAIQQSTYIAEDATNEVLVLTAVSASQTAMVNCASAADWWILADPLIVRFFDIAETASATARASLSGVILELSETHREFERLDYPECAQDVRDNLVSGMDEAVGGFNAFLSSDSPVGGSTYFSRANIDFYEASTQLLELNLVYDYRLAITHALIWGGNDPKITPSPEPTATETLAPSPTFSSGTFYVRPVGGIAVYPEPFTAGVEPIGELPQGAEIFATIKIETWYCFDFNGQQGCIHQVNLRDTPPN
jgi:hypothetical protein